MVRERRRLLISQQRLLAAPANDDGLPQLRLSQEESHYVSRVLRLKTGQELAIINGCGQLWGACVAAGDARRLELRLLQSLQAPEAELSPQAITLTLAIALPKRDSELLLRMACELGVNRLQPLVADRSVVAERFSRPRLEAILREATEQCERLWLPELADPIPSSRWFKEALPGLNLLATTRRARLPDPLTLLGGEPEGMGELRLAIGPEGGWSDGEEEMAAATGWRAVTLNGAILRTSTAAVAGLTLLSHWRDQQRPAGSSD